MNAIKEILVFGNHLTEVPELLGVLSAQCIRNKEVFSFEFDDAWLAAHPDQMLDPDLQMYSGKQFSTKANFGIFMDSSPDRWGRRLMLRREAIRAKKAGEKPRTLLESDYLLGVYDDNRMGAIRFKLEDGGAFLNNDMSMAAPPWTRLRELEAASRHLDDDMIDSEHERWLSMLLAPGSSLGGARPKASVVSESGEQWIAKFPSKGDAFNTSAWEYATSLMARDAGIRIPETRLENFSDNGSTFIAKRFDRDNSRRIHFASAMTLLGMTDGAGSDSGASYLDMAEFISKRSISPQKDLSELWRRMVFSIAVSNTDDHLRNHGFLLSNGGWTLSPAYDINPNPSGAGLSLNITTDDNSLDFTLALEVAPFFRLTVSEAESILKEIRSTVVNWRGYARRCGIAEHEMEMMETAFRLS